MNTIHSSISPNPAAVGGREEAEGACAEKTLSQTMGADDGSLHARKQVTGEHNKNMKDPKKTIEAVKVLRRELARNYLTWNSQSFEDFKKRASRIMSEHGIPESWWQEFASQSSSDEGPPYAIVQTDLNGNGTMRTSSSPETSSADNLLTKIERVKDALDSILRRLGCPVSQEDL